MPCPPRAFGIDESGRGLHRHPWDVRVLVLRHGRVLVVLGRGGAVVGEFLVVPGTSGQDQGGGSDQEGQWSAHDDVPFDVMCIPVAVPAMGQEDHTSGASDTQS